jgi:hypothetical protein
MTTAFQRDLIAIEAEQARACEDILGVEDVEEPLVEGADEVIGKLVELADTAPKVLVVGMDLGAEPPTVVNTAPKRFIDVVDNLTTILKSVEANEAKPTAEANESKPAERLEPMVPVGPGVSVPLTEFRAAADPRCKYCIGQAFQRVVHAVLEPEERNDAGKVTKKAVYKYKARPCGCALRGVQRKLAGERPSDPAPIRVVGADPELGKARARRKMQKLVTKLRKAEAEVAQRAVNVEDVTKKAAEAVEECGYAVKGEDLRRQCAEGTLMNLRADFLVMQRAIGRQEELVVKYVSSVAELKAYERAALEAFLVARVEAQKQDAAADGIRHRADNIRRCIDLFASVNEKLLEGWAPDAIVLECKR